MNYQNLASPCSLDALTWIDDQGSAILLELAPESFSAEESTSVHHSIPSQQLK